MASARCTRDRSRSTRGFTLVEVMVSAGILGIGLIGLVNLYGTSTFGAARAQRLAVATEIARQEAAVLLSEGPDPTGPTDCPIAGTTIGCRGTGRQLAATKPCTVWLRDADVPTESGAILRDTTQTSFRRDLVITAHPDTANHPGAQIATISVCYTDESGALQELQAVHLLVPGV
ncbi:prepilin-type N-terminal cleavage/methylation domain-containing protein [Myxococcota bacterium]|nr:prepilin-type N-terminal cleavage/methylation domain-containing protein [Myxococcota bacterium]